MTAGDGRPDDPRSREADDESLLTRFRTAESGPLLFLREVLTSVAAVALVGLLLFALSGVWPPMVAVESASMDPHMQKGDLVFVTESGRFMPSYAQDGTGIVTAEEGTAHDYRTFDGYGSVVIYRDPGRTGPPIIHRAMFWVEDGENWYDRANPNYVQGDSCSEVPNCPAPHAGFVTKGDNNAQYDQVSRIATVVKPDWIIGVARLRVPYLGWIRLGVSGAVLEGPHAGTAAATPMAGTSAPTTSAPTGPQNATLTATSTPTAPTTSPAASTAMGTTRIDDPPRIDGHVAA